MNSALEIYSEDAKPHRDVRNMVIFCHVPGFLTLAVRRLTLHTSPTAPVVVTEGDFVRDACPLALAQGITSGTSVTQARRLLPWLLAIPIEEVPHGLLSAQMLDLVADLSPVVEPLGPDAAYAVVTARYCHDAIRQLTTLIRTSFGLEPRVGLGQSRLAAQACAHCRLSPDRLGEASVDWLWREDTKIVGALKRLGLDTFGEVAAVGENALFYQFGKIGRLLHRRSLGQDFTPVRPLYPPPRANASYDLSDAPVEDWQALHAALEAVCKDAATQLSRMEQHGRRLVLRVTTERNEQRREWVLPVPVQRAGDVQRQAQRILKQMTLTAPVTGLRLLVEDLDAANAVTPSLFATAGDPASLQAARRILSTRYGVRSLHALGQMPQSLRDRRRACLQERWLTTP